MIIAMIKTNEKDNISNIRRRFYEGGENTKKSL